MPDIKVRVGQQNTVKVLASAYGGSLTAQNATNVIGGIASVTQLSNTGVSTLGGPVIAGSDLRVAGVSTFVGLSTFGGDVYIEGDLYLKEDITLDEISARSLTVSGVSTLGGLVIAGSDLRVAGVSTFVGVSTFGGDVYIGGDLHLKDDIVLDEISARSLTVSGVSTLGVTSTTLLESQELNVTGVSTFNNDVKFPGAAYNVEWDQPTSKFKFDDSAQLVFGSASGGDMKLFHASGNSTIRNETGQFRIAGNDIRLQSQNHSEDYILCTDGGAVQLFYNDVEKFATISTGATVTGDLYVSGDLHLKDDLVLDNITGNSLKISGISTFDGAIDANLGLNVSGGTGFVASTAKISDLTSGRVVYSGASGELQDSANLTFDGTELSAGLIDGGSY